MPQRIPPAYPPPAYPKAGAPIPLTYAAPSSAQALYLPRSVGIAAIIGGPIAGSIILAMNYRRIGKSATAWKTIALGVIATAALVAIGLILPRGPSLIVPVGVAVAMMKLAGVLQGEAIKRHQRTAGRMASAWKAAGVGAIVALILTALLFAGVFAYMATVGKKPLGTPLSVTGGTIYYSGSITPVEAKALADKLQELGYLTGTRRTSVIVERKAQRTTIKFVVDKDAARISSVVKDYMHLADQVAPTIGGKPIMMKLVDHNLEEIQSERVE